MSGSLARHASLTCGSVQPLRTPTCWSSKEEEKKRQERQKKKEEKKDEEYLHREKAGDIKVRKLVPPFYSLFVASE